MTPPSLASNTKKSERTCEKILTLKYVPCLPLPRGLGHEFVHVWSWVDWWVCCLRVVQLNREAQDILNTGYFSASETKPLTLEIFIIWSYYFKSSHGVFLLRWKKTNLSFLLLKPQSFSHFSNLWQKITETNFQDTVISSFLVGTADGRGVPVLDVTQFCEFRG